MAKSLAVHHEGGEDLESLAGRAYHILRDKIVCLEYPPGSLLSEGVLGHSHGISRTPIREALKRLEREYLVAILPRRGIIVTEVNLHDQFLLLEMRRGIEGRLFARAARDSTPAQRKRFAELAEAMGSCAANNDLIAHYTVDREFDDLIDVCGGNRYLSQALRPVHGLIRRFWQSQRGTNGSQGALDRHVIVAQAVASGDPGRVLAASKDLLDYNEAYFRSLLD